MRRAGIPSAGRRACPGLPRDWPEERAQPVSVNMYLILIAGSLACEIKSFPRSKNDQKAYEETTNV